MEMHGGDFGSPMNGMLCGMSIVIHAIASGLVMETMDSSAVSGSNGAALTL
jgi:hypothetical protein